MQERDCVGLAGEMCWLPGETDWRGRCRLHRRILVDSWTQGSNLTRIQLQVELSPFGQPTMACSNHPLEYLQTVQRSTGWLLLCSLTVSCVAPEGV